MRNILTFLVAICLLYSCAPENGGEATVAQSDNNILRLLSDYRIHGDDEFKSEVGYVAVVAPTLTDKNVFDLGLYMAGFYTYLENEAKGGVETVLIASDSTRYYETFINRLEKHNPELFESLSFVSDTSGQLIQKIASESAHLDHAGFALAYDKNGEFLYHLDEYRCQGEKLQRLYQTYYPRTIAAHPSPNYEIKEGEKLPAELLKYVGESLGKEHVMFTFYPSPLSHACSIQMDDFTHFSAQKNLKMFAVSIGNDEQINSWKMNQYVGLNMIADSTGIISNDFNSLLREEDGIVYSDRTVFIIDKNGIVKYINEDYDVLADLRGLESAILSLSE